MLQNNPNIWFYRFKKMSIIIIIIIIIIKR